MKALLKQLLAGVVTTGLAAGSVAAGPGNTGVKGSGGHAPAPQGGKPAPHGSPAGIPHNGGAPPNRGVSTYHQTHGKSFSGGYCYPGPSHCHWTYSGYSSKYGCTCYWCPSTCCYYYWCQPAGCYYPVTYCPPPAVIAVPVQGPAPAPYPAQVQVQVQTQTQTQVQGPPAGVPPLPR